MRQADPSFGDRQPRPGETNAAAVAMPDGLADAALLVIRPSDHPKFVKADRMSDTLPDRLSTNPNSPYYDAAVLERGVGIRFKGAEKTNVEEYCVSEGWIRVAVGNTRDRNGNPLTLKLQGPVEPYFRNLPASESTPEPEAQD